MSDRLEEITAAIGQRFTTFGGGRTSEWNPIATALADKPLMFAAGVDVRAVVAFVVERLNADRARMIAALEAAREALTRHQNLTATDKPHEYTDALNEGCDPNGAWDCYREATWTIDESDRLALIDAALLPDRAANTPAGAGEGA